MTELVLRPATLEGSTVILNPLSLADRPELTALALAHPQLWTHIPYAMGTADDVARALERALAGASRGLLLPFVTRLRESGELVGSSTLFLMDPFVPCVEIGATWVVPAFQRTRVNTEAKRLMLGHAFDSLGCARVELKTDERNERSRAAILRLGAREEGTHRNHMRRADQSLRNSVYFSITVEEWPEVRARLDARLLPSRLTVAESASSERQEPLQTP
jgi:N-acetyltransferase